MTGKCCYFSDDCKLCVGEDLGVNSIVYLVGAHELLGDSAGFLVYL